MVLGGGDMDAQQTSDDVKSDEQHNENESKFLLVAGIITLESLYPVVSICGILSSNESIHLLIFLSWV